MLKHINIILISLISLSSCTEQEISDEQLITSTMKEQQECWNNGDVECFMNHYWNNDSLRFIGSKGINYGWQKTLDNYKKSYPTKQEMGKLTFTLEQVKVFTATEAYVLGKWDLERNELDNLSGYFSLLWKKIEGKWVIVSDHTS